MSELHSEEGTSDASSVDVASDVDAERSTKEQILEGAHPERIVTQAIKRMLPGNRLSRQIMTNLRVYAGGDHPHGAQEPEVLDVKSMNPKNTRSA